MVGAWPTAMRTMRGCTGRSRRNRQLPIQPRGARTAPFSGAIAYRLVRQSPGGRGRRSVGQCSVTVATRAGPKIFVIESDPRRASAGVRRLRKPDNVTLTNAASGPRHSRRSSLRKIGLTSLWAAHWAAAGHWPLAERVDAQAPGKGRLKRPRPKGRPTTGVRFVFPAGARMTRRTMTSCRTLHRNSNGQTTAAANHKSLAAARTPATPSRLRFVA